MTHWKTRLLGLAATTGIGLFVLAVPVVLVSVGAVPTIDTPQRVMDVLASPDDGTLALGAMRLGAWIGWAVMTACFVLEAYAQLRGIHPPHLTGLGGPQGAAGQLIAVASLLFVTLPHPVPASTQLAVPTAAAALDTVPTMSTQTSPQAPPTPVFEAASVRRDEVHAAPEERTVATRLHTVRRGESLWSIARDQLGDGTRYVELVDLNAVVLGGRPDFLTPGLVLRVPDDNAPTESETVHVVEPGDTLSEIAADALDDADRYPEIYAASRHTLQPDGRRLTDPDLIVPG